MGGAAHARCLLVNEKPRGHFNRNTQAGFLRASVCASPCVCVCDVVRRAGGLVLSAGVLQEAEMVGAGP